MHISEGVLSGPVLISGAALAAAGTAIGLKKLDYDEIAKAGMLSAAFFVASLIHIPIGPANAHPLASAIEQLQADAGSQHCTQQMVFNGEERTYQCSLVPVNRVGKRHNAVLLVMQDITDLQQAQRKHTTLLRKLIRSGPGERQMWKRVYEAMEKKPSSHPFAMTELIRYVQVRTLYDAGGVWEPEVASPAARVSAN